MSQMYPMGKKKVESQEQQNPLSITQVIFINAIKSKRGKKCAQSKETVTPEDFPISFIQSLKPLMILQHKSSGMKAAGVG